MKKEKFDDCFAYLFAKKHNVRSSPVIILLSVPRPLVSTLKNPSYICLMALNYVQTVHKNKRYSSGRVLTVE